MISLSHHPIVQSTLDRWRRELPISAQLDESLITKEHLRLLITMLISASEDRNALTSDLRLLTSNRERP